ncbi:MAG: ArnT family glycosyltransferase [Candidatus Competibacterales bacterium]
MSLPSGLSSPLTTPREVALGWAVLAGVAGLSFFTQLNALPFFDEDEAMCAASTAEMLARRDFVSVYLDGAPHDHKPILTYWLQTFAAVVGGFGEGVLRLPSALAATAWGVAIVAFTARYGDMATARAAGLAFAGALLVPVIGRAATADALLNLWLALALLDIYRHSQTPTLAIRLRVYLWLGLGMLTKGPVALALPLLVSGAFYHVSGRSGLWWRAIFDLRGWLLLTAVLAPWLWLVYRAQGFEFFEQLVWVQNVERYTRTFQGHGGHWWYYLVVAPLVLLPVGSWVLVALGRQLRRGFDELDRFLLLWAGLVLGFFSLSQTQLPHYVLYGATPLFIFAARHRHALGTGPVSGGVLFAPALGLLAALAVLPAVAGAAAGKLALDPHGAEVLARAAAVLAEDDRYTWLTLGALGAGRWLAWTQGPRWQRLVALGVVQTAVVSFALLPAAGRVVQEPVMAAAALAGPGKGVVTFRTHLPSFSVYRGAPTPHRLPAPGELVFVRVDKLPALARAVDGPLDTVYAGGGVRLLRLGVQP